MGHLPSEGDVIGLVRAQHQAEHLGNVLRQAVIHAATVADQRFCGSINFGSVDPPLPSCPESREPAG
ncbi:hypothetical protein GCM10022284_09340 [Streptomyces hundungensis]